MSHESHTLGPKSDMSSSDSIQVNTQWWNERARLHAISDFYHLQSVIDGEIRLNEYEIEELGDVAGKDLVHLQCHLGTETIGWARLGAKVIGLDFSEEVVSYARTLAHESAVDVEYVQSNVYEAPKVLGENRFDIVYVNIGSLHWLPDINLWGETVERLLRPEGRLYVNEIHPIASVLADDSPTFIRNYFDTEQVVWDEDGSYADTNEPTRHNQHVIWDRPLSSVLNAVIRAGLIITNFQERAGQEYQQFPYQQQAQDGKWYSPDQFGIYPSTFSLTATKPKTIAIPEIELI